MTTARSNRKVAALGAACSFGLYGFITGATIGFGVGMDNLSSQAVLRFSGVLNILPTFCGLLVCRRFWPALDVAWLAILVAAPALGFTLSLQSSDLTFGGLVALILPILSTGLLSLIFLRWREKRLIRKDSSEKHPS